MQELKEKHIKIKQKPTESKEIYGELKKNNTLRKTRKLKEKHVA